MEIGRIIETMECVGMDAEKLVIGIVHIFHTRTFQDTRTIHLDMEVVEAFIIFKVSISFPEICRKALWSSQNFPQVHQITAPISCANHLR
jgi:hypothetical protein